MKNLTTRKSYSAPKINRIGNISKLTLKTGSQVDGGTLPGFV
jgi:hypothetical protein